LSLDIEQRGGCQTIGSRRKRKGGRGIGERGIEAQKWFEVDRVRKMGAKMKQKAQGKEQSAHPKEC